VAHGAYCSPGFSSYGIVSQATAIERGVSCLHGAGTHIPQEILDALSRPSSSHACVRAACSDRAIALGSFASAADKTTKTN
jgi:hypothetical protein